MTDVERLYELFQDIKCPNIFMCNAHELQLAEYLAANGVTFATDTNAGSKWISVEDRMPEPGTRVLAAHKNGTVVENYFSGITRDFTFSETYGPPTHWMPLPALPMKTKQEG